jgi:hypothetical protein
MEWIITASGRLCQTTLPHMQERQTTETEFSARYGSQALAIAIFETGKLHGPMTPERQEAAIRWAYGDRLKKQSYGW